MSLNSTPLFYKRPSVYKLTLPGAKLPRFPRWFCPCTLGTWIYHVDVPCGGFPCGIPLCFPQRGFAMC